MSDNVLTDKHVAAFAAAMKRWQMKLNMGDWRINLSDKPAPKTVLAQVSRFDLEARLATIRLNREWGTANPSTATAIDAVALHEMLHIFLHEMLQFASDPGANEVDTASAEHRVIQSLVNLLALGGKGG